MILCKICNETASLPFELNCGHIFCFICLKTYMINDGGSVCPQCNMFITDDITKVKVDDLYKYTVEHRKIYWAYSSNYVDHWWCYDYESCNQIEHIYNDYQSRLDALSPANKNLPVDVNVDLKTVKKVNTKDIITIDQKLSDLTDINTSNNLIDFTDISSDVSSDTNSESLSDSYNEKIQQTPLSYIVKICGIEYKIDFDQFKQINLTNSNKKRTIKRIVIDGKIENIENYLKTQYNVLGIAGVKF